VNAKVHSEELEQRLFVGEAKAPEQALYYLGGCPEVNRYPVGLTVIYCGQRPFTGIQAFPFSPGEGVVSVQSCVFAHLPFSQMPAPLAGSIVSMETKGDP
jgi:hypothetical protein